MVSYIDRKYDTTLFTGGSLVNSYIYSFTGLSTDTKPTRTLRFRMVRSIWKWILARSTCTTKRATLGLSLGVTDYI